MILQILADALLVGFSGFGICHWDLGFVISCFGFLVLCLSCKPTTSTAASEAAIAIFNTVRPVDPKPKPSRTSLWDGGFEILCKVGHSPTSLHTSACDSFTQGCDKDVLRPWMSSCPNCSSKCVTRDA